MEFTNLKKSLKPYSMAIVSVFIAVLSMSIVSLISMAGKSLIAKELDGIGLNGMSVSAYNSFEENITDNELYDILYNCRDISLLTPVLYDYATIDFSSGVQLESMCWGISPMAEDIVNLDLLHGRMFTRADISNSSFVCLVDENISLTGYDRSNIVGKELFVTFGDGVYKFEVVGIVNKTSSVLNGLSGEIIPNFIYIPYTTMENISGDKGIDQILINVADDQVTEQTIEDYIRRSGQLDRKTSLKITNLSTQRNSINNIVNTAFLALFAVSCVAVIVCSISVATSVNTAVSNARHDIGIKISLGARKIDIMAEFLFYSALACCIGIAFGIAGGWVVMTVANTFLHSSYTFDLSLLLWGISATILLTIIFSLYPSYQAASLLPVKALSRE